VVDRKGASNEGLLIITPSCLPPGGKRCVGRSGEEGQRSGKGKEVGGVGVARRGGGVMKREKWGRGNKEGGTGEEGGEGEDYEQR